MLLIVKSLGIVIARKLNDVRTSLCALPLHIVGADSYIAVGSWVVETDKVKKS